MHLEILLQHLLVIFLVVGMPLWDRYEVPRLKASTEPRKKIHFYSKIVAASWACTVLAVLTVGPANVYRIAPTANEIGWLQSGSRGGVVVEGIAAGMLIALLLPAVMALRSPKIREKAGKAVKKLAFLVPSSAEERNWWWVVSITAGICEEVVYRGFLLHYLHVLPFHLSLTWALVAASVIFGIGHLYQGVAGGLQTSVAGFVLGCLFVVSGSLLVPMVVHAVMDLRVLALLPEGFDKVEGGAFPR